MKVYVKMLAILLALGILAAPFATASAQVACRRMGDATRKSGLADDMAFPVRIRQNEHVGEMERAPRVYGRAPAHASACRPLAPAARTPSVRGRTGPASRSGTPDSAATAAPLPAPGGLSEAAPVSRVTIRGRLLSRLGLSYAP